MFETGYQSDDDLAALDELIGEEMALALRDEVRAHLAETLAEARALMASSNGQFEHERLAGDLIKMMIPRVVDPKLWRDLARGTLQLPASDQYGSSETRLGPLPRTRGNAFGAVHSKGRQEPSAFMARQSDFVKTRIKRIAGLEAKLQEERDDLEASQSGMQLYAATLLLTSMRNQTAPMFAMGPAWAVMRAIAGETGREVVPEDRGADTRRILSVLLALRDDPQFLREIKTALLDVCHRFRTAAHQRGRVPEQSEGEPIDFPQILDALSWSMEGPQPQEEPGYYEEPDDD